EHRVPLSAASGAAPLPVGLPGPRGVGRDDARPTRAVCAVEFSHVRVAELEPDGTATGRSGTGGGVSRVPVRPPVAAGGGAGVCDGEVRVFWSMEYADQRGLPAAAIKGDGCSGWCGGAAASRREGQGGGGCCG